MRGRDPGLNSGRSLPKSAISDFVAGGAGHRSIPHADTMEARRMAPRYQAGHFDAWADQYDRSVHEATGFPFAGYEAVLQEVVRQAAVAAGSCVLDLGTGTGNLARLFAAQGCEVWALEFSAKMCERALAAVPGIRCAQVDILGPWPEDFRRRFDGIVSAYVFHHFDLATKVAPTASR